MSVSHYITPKPLANFPHNGHVEHIMVSCDRIHQNLLKNKSYFTHKNNTLLVGVAAELAPILLYSR